MTLARKQLLETLAGHFAWLAATHPSKANAPVARRAKRQVAQSLRAINASHRKAA